MARRNLTTRFIESVTVNARTDFWDDGVRGLVLRASPSGAKSWSVVYTTDDGDKRRLTIGRFPAIDLQKARRKALDTVTSVADGDDPAGEKRARKTATTVADLAGLYVEKYAKRHKKTWQSDERILNVDVLPLIGTRRLIDLKKRDVLDVIDAKAETGALAQSTQILAVVRKMLNWAVDEDYIETSPAVGVKPRRKPVQRDRVLSTDEMRRIWNALPEASISQNTADVIRMLFLTGQRSGEVCGMVRGEIDIDRAVWMIPSVRTKNGRPHVVHLSGDAIEILGTRLQAAEDEPGAALFSRVGEPIESNAIAQATRKALQLFDQKWTPHDIRRTVATMMAEAGVLPHVVEATLNHISGFRAGVAGVYNRASYEREKRQALDLWAEQLREIVTEKKSNIARIRRGEA